MPRQSFRRAFGAIKTLTRLAHTNSSVDIDRMDDYQAMYHEKSDIQCLSFVHTQMMPRKRLILREEVFRVIMMLKRQERTNPSVRIDRLDDYQAIYHKTSDAQLISFVYEQSPG